ncbi:tetratricopeptide repeat protein [Catellatospora tritici]|uniref:tetratricopeptide repeat protein n=1 Tax=Catellatospora tritici TaxID=2851566 RepID=UPI001C2D5A66|nr:tetratricopeptide repeat protein [Catellatospora tritici]MBV1854245.1 tetratricopeptide repeat protein [Catellatospora tritici]
MWRRIAAVVITGFLLTGLGGALGAAPAAPVDGAPGELAYDRPDPVARGVAQLQRRLADVPGDWAAWAALGTAYVEQARRTGDPGYYPRAQGALDRSRQVRADNDAALVGLGALANARHDFGQAERLARQALSANPWSADAYGVLADALTQLGRPAEATTAVQRMLDLRPGLPALARAAYDLEQHGQVETARELWTRALAAAVAPADVAFVRQQLGDLAWHAGDRTAAAEQYRAGLAADPHLPALRLGLARVDAGTGHTDAALSAYADLAAAQPAPSLLVEYAQLLTAAGHPDAAREQLRLAGAALALLAANGGGDELAAAEVALAIGDTEAAVAHARAEWRRRQHTDVADLLGWALHRAGRSREALTYARAANALGTRSAGYAYHLGMIELALGDRAAARRDLARALALNPHFSPVDAPAAARALTLAGAR